MRFSSLLFKTLSFRSSNVPGSAGSPLVLGEVRPAPALEHRKRNRRGSAGVVLAGLATSLSSCAPLAVLDPHVDDGTAAFAAACVGVLAAERAYVERGGGTFTVPQHRALSEWMFQASYRRNLLDHEIGRATERRRWAESLPADERSKRLRACSLSEAPALPEVPEVLDVRSVLVAHENWAGERALEVRLTSDEQTAQLSGSGSNGPTYAIIDQRLSDGVIEVDVAAINNGRGGADARGFAGLAFHLSDDAEEFEAVYLRMGNGTLNTPRPESPRDARAIQYVAHPGFHFDVSRQQSPGRYESSAPVGLGTWHRLRLEIAGLRLVVFVDGAEVLRVDDLRRPGIDGRVALWVGGGSSAYFRNLSVRRSG